MEMTVEHMLKAVAAGKFGGDLAAANLQRFPKARRKRHRRFSATSERRTRLRHHKWARGSVQSGSLNCHKLASSEAGESQEIAARAYLEELRSSPLRVMTYVPAEVRGLPKGG